MAWTNPRTWVVGELVTAAIMNTHIRDNQVFSQAEACTVWTPATTPDNGGAVGTHGNWPVILLGAINESALMSFPVPAGFTALVAADIVVIADCTDAAAEWSIYSEYGTYGEAYNVHSESDILTTYNATQNDLIAVDCTGILTGIAADDFVGLEFVIRINLDHAYVVGFYMTYT